MDYIAAHPSGCRSFSSVEASGSKCAWLRLLVLSFPFLKYD
jgi:hypothetical protein